MTMWVDSASQIEDNCKAVYDSRQLGPPTVVHLDGRARSGPITDRYGFELHATSLSGSCIDFFRLFLVAAGAFQEQSFGLKITVCQQFAFDNR